MLPKILNQNDIINLFPKTAQDIELLAKKTMEIAQESLKNLIDTKASERTFENTIAAYDEIAANFNVAATIMTVLEMVSPNGNVRDAASKFIVVLTNFSIDNFSQNIQLYKAIKEYADTANLDALSPEKKYTLQELLKDFKKTGLHLEDAIQQKIKAVKKELGELEVQFDKNIATDNRFIEADKDELTDLDESFIKSLQLLPNGKYKLGVDYPTYYAVIENCSNESVRKKLWKEFVNRGYPVNEKVLKKIISLRDQLSKLLGYKSYSDLDIDGEMAHDTKEVEKFLGKLIAPAKEKVLQEQNVLKSDLPKGVSLTSSNKFKPWDIAYSRNYYKKKHLSIDEIKISEYFPLDTTLKALFEIYENFFEIKLKKVDINSLWHQDVLCLEVTKDNKFIGYILLDLFPRDNKYTHACEITIVPTVSNGDFYPALILVIANFPKATKDTPALLKRQDVITFFHEFGHAIHAILGATQLACNSGASVKRDFVEMPSQMLEEWMWQPEVLKSVSYHYKNGQSLSDDLISKIIELKNFDSGDFVQRQAYYSLLSLKYFQDGAEKDVYKISQDLFNEIITNVEFDPEFRFYASFGHLMGYGAKYYGYLWSKVFALDLFDTIKKLGFSKEIGKKYVNTILSKGGSADPELLIENFLGRQPSEKQFFETLL